MGCDGGLVFSHCYIRDFRTSFWIILRLIRVCRSRFFFKVASEREAKHFRISYQRNVAPAWLLFCTHVLHIFVIVKYNTTAWERLLFFLYLIYWDFFISYFALRIHVWWSRFESPAKRKGKHFSKYRIRKLWRPTDTQSLLQCRNLYPYSSIVYCVLYYTNSLKYWDYNTDLTHFELKERSETLGNIESENSTVHSLALCT